MTAFIRSILHDGWLVWTIQNPSSQMGPVMIAKGGAETPDTQLSVFEFDDLMMTFEMTLNTPYMLKADHGIRDGDMFPHWAAER